MLIGGRETFPVGRPVFKQGRFLYDADMKTPPFVPPQNAPADTVWIGGPIPWFSMSIEITADDLVPDEVTALLGVTPTQTQQKGKPWTTADGKKERIGKFGRWSLRLDPAEANELEVAESAVTLLNRVPADIAVWEALSCRATIRLSVGLGLESLHQGLSIDPGLLRRLADRRMALDLAIYAFDDMGVPAQPGGLGDGP
jgi:hypothetical protein